ncbi:MAG: hypothetical protein ACE5D8_08595 [Fidelibacterota bacterium]
MRKKAHTSRKRNVALLGAAVGIVMILVLQYDRPAPLIIPEPSPVRPTVQTPVSLPTVDRLNEMTAETRSEPVPDIPGERLMPSFAEAFADARETLGPGQVFYWNGQAYTTDLADERHLDELVLDSTDSGPPAVSTPSVVTAVTTP